MQLHHRFDGKRASSFQVAYLKGDEIEKWARCQTDATVDVAGELRELQLLIGRGRFRSRDFLIAQHQRRLIGKLRLRGEEAGRVALEMPIVLSAFDYYEVARALVARAIETLRTEERTPCVIAEAQRDDFARVLQHTGFQVTSSNEHQTVYSLLL